MEIETTILAIPNSCAPTFLPFLVKRVQVTFVRPGQPVLPEHISRSQKKEQRCCGNKLFHGRQRGGCHNAIKVFPTSTKARQTFVWPSFRHICLRCTRSRFLSSENTWANIRFSDIQYIPGLLPFSMCQKKTMGSHQRDRESDPPGLFYVFAKDDSCPTHKLHRNMAMMTLCRTISWSCQGHNPAKTLAS